MYTSDNIVEVEFFILSNQTVCGNVMYDFKESKGKNKSL